jgi:hypothetical protein
VTLIHSETALGGGAGLVCGLEVRMGIIMIRDRVRSTAWPGRPPAQAGGLITSFAQPNASAYRARHSMPRSRARLRNTSSSHQSLVR